MNTEIIFRSIQAEDWASVAAIYKQGIDTGNATFQQEIPTWAEWDNGHLKKCRIVAVADHEIVGWAALMPVSSRRVYAGVAEVSVYVSVHHMGQHIGKKLLEQLIKESEENNFWTLQAGIFPENIASIKIHIDLGFRQVGYREKIGKMNDDWRDIYFFEKRSEKVGI
ncbi:MAG: N-acetyltransferase family protein [Ginsengibacter sp.]